VQCNDETVRRVPLVPGRMTVGRAPEAGLRLDSRFVSRRHCQLITTADQTIIEDLGSSNGLRVNGRRHRVHQLVAGDKVEIGDYTLVCAVRPEATEG
jgi:pSer/pThr/pTyr-binding forkhead associated (FHA) protein